MVQGTVIGTPLPHTVNTISLKSTRMLYMYLGTKIGVTLHNGQLKHPPQMESQTYLYLQIKVCLVVINNGEITVVGPIKRLRRLIFSNGSIENHLLYGLIIPYNYFWTDSGDFTVII